MGGGGGRVESSMDLFYCLILSGVKISPHSARKQSMVTILPQQELSHKDDDSEQRICDQFNILQFCEKMLPQKKHSFITVKPEVFSRELFSRITTQKKIVYWTSSNFFNIF
jgi:hypothetical protein